MNSSPPPLPPPSRLLQLPLRNTSPKRLRNAKNLSLNVPSFSQLQVAASCATTPKTATASTFDIALTCSEPLPTSLPTITQPTTSQTISTNSRSHPNNKQPSTRDLPILPTHYFKNNHSSSSTSPLSSLPSSSTSPSSSTPSPSCIQKSTQNLSIVIPSSNKNSLQNNENSNTVFTSPSSISSSSADSYSSSNNAASPNDRVVVVNTLPLNDPNDFTEPSFTSYPSGPIVICQPNIYLYSEPTRDEASQFDVVINVAKEVKNPFQSSTPDSITPASHSAAIYDYDTLSTHSSISSLSSSSSSSYSTNLSSLSPSSSPDITLFPESRHDPFFKIDSALKTDCINPSKSISNYYPSNSTKIASSPSAIMHNKDDSAPEYVYVPWDHNSPITQDLEYLTDLIADRSKKGKRILVHCQCGVSRSASLVVAYVMKSENWGVHQAYQWVKDKSPGISPNMSLIYQLVEWSRVLKSKDVETGPFHETCNFKKAGFVSFQAS